MDLEFDIPKVIVRTNSFSYPFTVPISFYVNKVIDMTLDYTLEDVVDFLYENTLHTTPTGQAFLKPICDTLVPISAVQDISFSEEMSKLELKGVTYNREGGINRYESGGIC